MTSSPSHGSVGKYGKRGDLSGVHLTNVLILDDKLQMQILKCVYNEMISGNKERGDIKDKCMQILPYLVRQFHSEYVFQMATNLCKRLSQHSAQVSNGEDESDTLTIVTNGIKAMCGAIQTAQHSNVQNASGDGTAITTTAVPITQLSLDRDKSKESEEEKNWAENPNVITKKIFQLIDKTAAFLLEMIGSTQTEMHRTFIQFIQVFVFFFLIGCD
ncbi:hypothetical protein RFI_19055 [Reticulomyxa filosa]|uniref:Uncharacterized protein n=1 Tax=Reticulomyxa filosa TaxID=46433 RepID=X6MYT2_RETFI|nr:hypothetical protein RFI_19055 [Reticulomyxa filosa]|eukprot:ETO18225.1 hypothetical protein RFI_19055 [Reticulomyxa filosa]